MVTDAANNQNQVEERRHPTLYFEDGDIAISATSKAKDYIEFYRVDKVFLARHSPIFKDMLSLGENDPHNEQYYGVPKVHLLDDAEDVSGLIGALYNMATLPLSKPCHDTPRKVEGIMRLAVKYDIQPIRTVILRHIESEWPQTLLEWEQRHKEQSELQLTDVEEHDDTFLGRRFPDPALAVRFGMEFDCPKILPAAFYELATEPNILSKTTTWDCLHASDLLALVAGKKALASCLTDTSTRILNGGQIYCSVHEYSGATDTKCEKWATKHVINATLQSEQDLSLFDPLSFLLRLSTSMNDSSNLGAYCCTDTYEVTTRAVKKDAETVWENLPEYFSLPK